MSSKPGKRRKWNPRFAAYAKASGDASPYAALRRLKTTGPGYESMYPFIEWNDARIKEYRKINPDGFTCGGLTDHAGYDRWLKEYAEREATRKKESKQ